MSALSIVLLVLAVIILVGGILIVSGAWNPLQKADEKGEKAPLTRKEKATVGGFVIMILLAILSLLFTTEPVWLQRLRKRVETGE